MGNRRKGDVWKYFIKVSENAHGKAKVSCTFCGCTYLENATRMSTHLLKCSGYLKLHNIFTSPVEELQAVGSSSYISPDNQTYEASFSRSEDPVRQNLSPPTRSPVGEQLYLQQDEEIRKNIANAIFVSGLPLSLLEEPRWINIFKSLKPSFTLPTVTQFESYYLEKEYCGLKSHVDIKIYGSSHFGIKCKGSKQNDLNFFYVTTPTTYFYKALKKPSKENLQVDCESLIDNLVTEFGTEKVISIVADSSTGLLSGAKFIEKKYPHVAVYQCIFEAMTMLCDNILVSSIFHTLWTRLEDLKCFLITLTNEKMPYALQNFIWIFKKYDRFIFDYILRIKSLLKDFLMSQWNSEKDTVEKRFLDDDDFWKPIEEMDKILQPILTSISKYKENPPPINHIIPLFDSLQTHFEGCMAEFRWEQTQQSRFMAILKDCKNSALHPVHFASNFFDPLSKGNTLSLEQQMLATDYAYKLAVLFKKVNDEDCLVDMANYKANAGLWGTDYIWKPVHKLHPISWWNGFCSNTNLSQIAVRLFNLPSVAFGGEGEVYSAYESHPEFLHNLAPPQKDMLLFVSINLKLIDNHQNKEESKAPETQNYQEQVNTLTNLPEKPIPMCIPKQENQNSSYEL